MTEEVKVYFNRETENVPIPDLVNYENILYTPTELADINAAEGAQLEQNVTDISGNAADIVVNASGIAINVTDISGNAAGIIINANGISAEVTDRTNADSTLQGSINVNSGDITAAVVRITTNEGTILTHTGEISVNSDNIALRVKKHSAPGADEIISEINLSTEGVKITGENIQLSGNTEVLGNFTVTGNIVQTSASDKRIKLSSSSQNRVQFLDGATVVGYLEIEKDGDVYYLGLGGAGGMLEIGTVLGAAAISYVSMPWFAAAGKASAGQVAISGSPNYATAAGLSWSGGGVASFRFDLGSSMAKLKIPVGANMYE